MRWMFRLVILGLAAVGAQRLYELARPRIEEMRGQAGSRFHEVADTAKSAAEDVRQDLKAASQQVKDDLAPPVEDAKTALEESMSPSRASTGSQALS